MRIEVHVPLKMRPETFERVMEEAANELGYGLRKNAGELDGFQSTIVVTSEVQFDPRGGTYSRSTKYLAISCEIWKLGCDNVGPKGGD